MAVILVRTGARKTTFSLTGKISIRGVNLQYFHSFGISNVLVGRLKDSGIVKPTAIQTKALKSVLEGNNTVINAETGSGKTLCYLLPIVHNLIVDKQLASKPPYAVVLLPNIELCYQVANVFQSLTDKTVRPCVVHRDSRLLVDHRYPIVLATPSALLNYRLSSLDNVRVVVIDEADLLLTSGGDRVWEILSFFKGTQTLKEKRRQKRLGKGNTGVELCMCSNVRRTHETPNPAQAAKIDNSGVETARRSERQFIFVAATLPSRGPQAAYNVLNRWLPEAEFVSTELAHHTVPTVGIFYVKVLEILKLPELLHCLNSLIGIVMHPPIPDSKGGSAIAEVDNDTNARIQKDNKVDDYDPKQNTPLEDVSPETSSENLLEAVGVKDLRVLVFANTTKSAQRAFSFLTESKAEPEDADFPWKHSTSDDVTTTTWEDDSGDFESNTSSQLVTDTGSKSYWLGKVGQIHKNIPPSSRIETLQRFKSGELKVLICTDLASRGLDIPDVSHVIQLDFAPNAAQVLHRTGRTARAGAPGKVINFITEDDEDLARAVRACEESANADGYQATFSRNRMLRRRFKANTVALADKL